LNTPIYIQDFSSISALGLSREVWDAYLSPESNCIPKNFGDKQYSAAPLKLAQENIVQAFVKSNGLAKQDRSIQLACFTAQQLKENNKLENGIGVNAGSSRGATQHLEEAYQLFSKTGKVKVQTSPQTTAGNVASSIAQTIGSNGIAISHSITCSTLMHAFANAQAWLKAGMAKQFIVCGTEAPLTPFTLAQMNALRVYSKDTNSAYPCQPLNFEKENNSMVLGEGAISFLLTTKAGINTKLKIDAIGFSRELVDSGTGISEDGKAIQFAMKMALKDENLKDISAIIMHAPGTLKGDMAEMYAINTVFDDCPPPVTSNKWKMGHTFGASGGFSLEMAYHTLKNKTLIMPPYLGLQLAPINAKKILVNSVGFGGNAISILVSLP